PSPFVLHGWIRAIWPLLAEPRISVARKDGRLVGALPLDIRARRGVRVAELAGGMDAHLADLLLAPGENGEVADVLVAEAGRGGFVLVALCGRRAGSGRASVPGRRLRERVGAPVLDRGRDGEGVSAAKASAKTRQTHRRKRRRLAEQGRLESRLATE